MEYGYIVLVVASSIWVLVDAKQIGVRKGLVKGFFDIGAFTWFVCCLLLWLIAFPCYLAKRSAYKTAAR